jgi:hypothetical protein
LRTTFDLGRDLLGVVAGREVAGQSPRSVVSSVQFEAREHERAGTEVLPPVGGRSLAVEAHAAVAAQCVPPRRLPGGGGIAQARAEARRRIEALGHPGKRARLLSTIRPEPTRRRLGAQPAQEGGPRRGHLDAAKASLLPRPRRPATHRPGQRATRPARARRDVRSVGGIGTSRRRAGRHGA